MERKKRKGVASELSSHELRSWGVVPRRREGVGREASLRLIYPKVMATKKAVKSEIDVAERMTPGVLDERIQQSVSAGELPRQQAV